MVGFLATEDDFDADSEENSAQFNECKCKTALSVEDTIVLDLAQAVVRNMRNENEGRLKHMLIVKQFGKF